MSASPSSNAVSVSSSRGTDAHTLFRCCLCRCSIAIDTRKLTCDKQTLSRTTTSATVDSSSFRPFCAECPQETVHSAQHESCARENALSDAINEKSLLREAKHPALRGSLQSAAGKYRPLSPAPLTALPLSTTQCEKRKTLTTAVSFAQIVARLSLIFAYPYGWTHSEDANAFVSTQWRTFHSGVVPAPAAPSALTVQRSDFASARANIEPLAATTRDVSRSSAAISLKPHDAALGTHCLSSPSSSSCAAAAFSPPDAQESVGWLSPALHSHCSFPSNPRAALTPEHLSRLFSARPPSHSLSSASASFPALPALPAPSAPSAPSAAASVSAPASAPATSPPAAPTPAALLAHFAASLMRHVARGGGADLPLCARCWAEGLAARRGEARRAAGEAAHLLAALARPGEERLVLACPPGSAEGPARVGRTAEEAGEEEELQRLMIEVREAEAREELLDAECSFGRSTLALLLTKRQEKEAEETRNQNARNAQEVKDFFEREDAISSMAQRIENMTSSCAFLSRSHAMLLAFPINTSGPVGTIAGLRLGQMPAPPSNTSRKNNNNKDRSSASEHGPLHSSTSLACADEASGSSKCPPSASAVASDSSSESTTLLYMLHVQQTYTQNLLGGREDRVSVAEINCACGFLLHIVKHLASRHRIRLTSAALYLNGDQSKVDALISTKGNPPKPSGRPADFFINEKIFSWKTFGSGCVLVSSCVQEIASKLKDILARLRSEAESIRTAHSNSVTNTMEWDMEGFMAPSKNSSNNDNNISDDNNNDGDDDDELDWWVLHSTTPEDPPFSIAQGEVDGFSVRHGDTSEGLWTIGMKKLLSVVQWCVLASRDVDVLERLLKKKSQTKLPAEIRE